MATAKRGRRAHQPGMKGAPQRIDHHRVLVSRAQGWCGRDRDGGGSERGERLSNPRKAEEAMSEAELIEALVEAVRLKQWERARELARRLVGADALCHRPDAGQLACANGAHRSNIAFLIALPSN